MVLGWGMGKRRGGTRRLRAGGLFGMRRGVVGGYRGGFLGVWFLEGCP